MNLSRRVVLSFLSAAVVLFAGLLFWPFILNNIIKPMALVVWLLLRIFVLSIDQEYVWYAFVFVAAIFLFRLIPQGQDTRQLDTYLEANTTLDNIERWRARFTYYNQNIWDEKALKRELLHLLTSLYASKQNTSVKFAIHTALQQGEIPLPDHIYTFLFPQEPQAWDASITAFLQSIRGKPRKWIRQWTGQEKAEHYQRITEVLDFMEATLEIKNDDRQYTQAEH
ncbi:MAG TPA: hypothetical protein VFQ13_12405 [Anaerolineales bacterium]|nr:hypothetical protein [Anaerolineales bacterium]